MTAEVQRLELAHDLTIYLGDVRDGLRAMPTESVHCCVTSPPYWNLRDYQTGTWEGGDPACDHMGEPMRTRANINANCGTGVDRKNSEGREFFRETCGKCGARRVDRQLGLEPTPEEYVATLVEVFREVRRVLRQDGTLWINLGDTYAREPQKGDNRGWGKHQTIPDLLPGHNRPIPTGLKPKDLVGIPWAVAFALRADGWYLRSAFPWIKPNAMPESVDGRPTTATEMWFLLTKHAGAPILWSHRDGKGSRKQPKPDYRWIDNVNEGAETAEEPPEWRKEMCVIDGEKRKRWDRINLWSGRDYFYDAEAVAVPAVTMDPTQTTFKREGAKYSDPNPGQSMTSHRPDRPDTPPKDTRNRRTSDWFDESIDLMISRLLHLKERGGLMLNQEGMPLALVANTEQNPDAHFATFGRQIITPQILAGSSPKTCPHCAAPWRRVVEKVRTLDGKPIDRGGWAQNDAGQLGAQGVGHWRFATQTTTTGWAPTCSCPENDGSGKAIVLDPFLGSGTTAQVAIENGRAAVGCELNPQYVEIAKKRLRRAQPGFAIG